MPDNRKLMLNLFASLQDALFLGDPFERGEFVSIMHPGQFLSSHLKEGRDSNDMAVIAEEANAIFDTITVSQSLLGSVNSIYEDVLRMAALPFEELGEDIELELEKLRTWLANAEPAYQLYSQRYLDASEAYDQEAHSQSPNPSRLKRLLQAKEQAMKAWRLAGNKDLYDRKFGRYVYLIGPDPATLWAEYQAKYEGFKERAPQRGDYLATFLSPSISSWNSPGTSWGRFEREIREQDTYSYSKQTSWSGSAGGGWGLWRAKAGGSGSTDYRYRKSDVSSVHVAFDYLRVRIHRPWLHESIFGYPFWTWKKTFGGRFISDGGNLSASPPVRPIGLMPVLPKYLIVVRNVELSAIFSREEQEYIHKEVKVSASGGWGPFSASGSYKESTTEQRYEATFDGTTLRIEQPQVIAKTGVLLSRTPNPDLSLSWKEDAWLPGNDQISEFKKLRSIRLKDYASNLAEEIASERIAEQEKIFERRIDRVYLDVESDVIAKTGEKP